MTDALRPITDASSGDPERLELRRPSHSSTETPADDRRWGVWLSWVVHTVTGYLVAGLLVVALLIRVPGRLALAPTVGLVGLAAVALLQWLVLRRHRPALRWWSWIVAALSGQIVGSIVVGITAVASIFLSPLRTVVQSLGASTAQTATQLVAGGLLGAAVGFAQWIVLRRHLSAAGWWIAATALAGALAALVPSLLYLGLTAGGSAAQIVGRLMTGVIVGAVTGAALVRLLARPRPTARSE